MLPIARFLRGRVGMFFMVDFKGGGASCVVLFITFVADKIFLSIKKRKWQFHVLVKACM